MGLRAMPAAIGVVFAALALVTSTAGSIPVAPEEPGAVTEHLIAEEGPRPGSLADLIPNPTVMDPAVLAGIEADPALIGEPGEKVVALRSDLERAQQTRRWALAEVDRRTASILLAEEVVIGARRASEAATDDRRRAEGRLEQFSVDAFIAGSDQPGLGDLLGSPPEHSSSAATQALRAAELFGAAGTELGHQLEARRLEEASRQEAHEAATAALDRQRALLDTAVVTLGTARTEIAFLEPQLAAAERRLEEYLLLRALPGTEHLTLVAVDAYYNASRIAAERWPECRVRWFQLAGVGRVESFHGWFGSSRLDRRGNAAPRILGPQLNGDPWLEISDTDAGMLDGDLEWDRAVGPMQFIPSSWTIFAADGNGDRIADPNNLYDAALAAADHLCGVGLEDHGRFTQALLGYNRSRRYGADVVRFSGSYAGLADLPDPWAPTESGTGLRAQTSS